jgi:hypothetical protein
LLLHFLAEESNEIEAGRAAEAEFSAFARYNNRREAQAVKEGNYKPLSWRAKWSVTRVHQFGTMPLARLAEILREKEGKAKEYQPSDAYCALGHR